MTSRPEATRLRVRVDDDPALTWDLGPEDVTPGDRAAAPGDPGRPHRTIVSDAAAAAAERASGIGRFDVTVAGWQFSVRVEDGARARLRERATQDAVRRAHHGPAAISAPMTGRVVRIWVTVGDTVEAGQRLLAIEAMKMENEVRASRAGVVASVLVAVGDSVEHGDELVTVR